MMISGKDIPNRMIETYVRAIKHSRTTPTLAADVARMEMHDRIVQQANTTRHDNSFLGALSDVVYDLI